MDNPKVNETYLPTAETVLPNHAIGETVLEMEASSGADKLTLTPGQTIANSYVVIKPVEQAGVQSSVYIAQKEGKQCAIKVYNKGYQPPENLMKELVLHTCPYVAELYDYGYQGEHYYEVYRYYSSGTLEDKGKCNITFIKDVVVPNMNEAFHFLHKIGDKGIVHGDIKPSNIFLADNEDKIIIGDFGISSYLDKDGMLIDEIKGTPEYAPRTKAFFGKVTKTSAYDYGAMGLVLIKLATGHSLFNGLSIEKITSMWNEGLEKHIPKSIDGRLKRLISNLLIEDEDKRFGYQEVKKWCEGEFIKTVDNSIYRKEDFEKEKEVEPLVFGVFNDRILAVLSLEELRTAIINNWEHTKKQMRRETFYEFIRQFGDELEMKIREVSSLKDEDEAVFKLIYTLKSGNRIIFKGNDYGTIKEFVQRLNEQPSDEMAEIIKSGYLEYFLRQDDKNAENASVVARIVKKNKDNFAVIPQMIYYIFNKEKEYILSGKVINTVEELVNEISNLQLEEIEKLTYDSKFIAWLYTIGYEEEVLKVFKL